MVPIQLGSTVKDKITKLVGVATARVEYITACTQVFVQPPVDVKTGKFVEGTWCDEQRLDLLGRTVIKLDNRRAGAGTPPSGNNRPLGLSGRRI